MLHQTRIVTHDIVTDDAVSDEDIVTHEIVTHDGLSDEDIVVREHSYIM